MTLKTLNVGEQLSGRFLDNRNKQIVDDSTHKVRTVTAGKDLDIVLTYNNI